MSEKTHALLQAARKKFEAAQDAFVKANDAHALDCVQEAVKVLRAKSSDAELVADVMEAAVGSLLNAARAYMARDHWVPTDNMHGAVTRYRRAAGASIERLAENSVDPTLANVRTIIDLALEFITVRGD